jgi:acetylglutamate/LysW-gamma-L-alpha-aminoadipate kinase
MIVVKHGGSTPLAPAAVCGDIAELTAAGKQIVLVHGGSAEMARLAGQLDVRLRTLATPDGVTARYTDEATLDVLTLALAGRVKPALVAELARRGVPALGLTGIDAGLLRARRRRAVRAVVDGKTVVVRDDHSGRISQVNVPVLRTLLAARFVPVLSPPALDDDGLPVNSNADRVAAAVAAALGAECLVFLTAVPGVLRVPGDPASLMPRYRLRPLAAGRDEALGSGMVVKLAAAADALAGGVRRVVIADGRRERPLRSALAGQQCTEVLPAD